MEASNTFCDKQSSLKEGWSPPPLGIYKVNVNGATSNDGQPSSIGVIIRISKGETIAAGAELEILVWGGQVVMLIY